MKDTQKQIDKETKKLKQKAVNVVLYAHKQLVEGSPADTGLYRNNHIITINRTTNKVNDKANKENNPTTDTMPTITKMKFNDGDKIIIQNNLSYANQLEARGGKSKPPALYRRTENKTKDFIKDLKWV